MPTLLAHALVAVSLAETFPAGISNRQLLIAGSACAMLPDLDVIAFGLGIPYGDLWGHRGLSHSFAFAALVGVFATVVFWKAQELFSQKGLLLFVYFFACTSSHAILDALTDGGLGVAFFAPFENGRYFFPWRPIAVSPIGIARFLSHRGLAVLTSELIWIGIPCLLVVRIAKRRRSRVAGK